MAQRRMREEEDQGTPPNAGPGYRGGARNQTDSTGVRQGNRGQPADGEKDARGLTRDSTRQDGVETPVPGDAARGPWSVDTTPKGD